MTPDEQKRHISLVREMSKTGGPLDKDGPHSTMRNLAWYRLEGERKASRSATHERLKAAVIAQSPKVRAESRALVLAGPPGAGKVGVASAVLGPERERYVNIDADEFKKLLLREAIKDGSYDSWIKPLEVRDLEVKGEQFYPLELASLVHEESSMLATELREDLMEQGTNIIVDTVLGDPDKAVELGNQLADAGYQVTVIDVEVPFEVSEYRIQQRWQQAMQEAQSGKADALGGRWVPSS